MASFGERWKKNKTEKCSAKTYNNSINFYDINGQDLSGFDKEREGEEFHEGLGLDLTDSIYKFNLSERTYNALIKNGISRIEDFFPFRMDIRQMGSLRGLGMNAIKELHANFSIYWWYHGFNLSKFFEKAYNKTSSGDVEISNTKKTDVLEKSFSMCRFLSVETVNTLAKHGIYKIKDLYPYRKNLNQLSNIPGIGPNVISELNREFIGLKGYESYSLENLFSLGTVESINKKGPFFVYNGLSYYIFSPCFIVFSERVRACLKKNKMSFFDLLNKRTGEFYLLQGMGKAGVEEIKQIKERMLGYFHIPESAVKYLEFDEVDQLDFFALISVYYSNLSDLQKDILNSRMKRFSSSDKLTLETLGEKYKITRERIRQIEMKIQSDFEDYIKLQNQYLEKFLVNTLVLQQDIMAFKYENFVSFNQFSYDFIKKIFPLIFNECYLFYSNDYNETFVFIKNNGLLLKDQIDSIIKFIDKKCLAQRTTIKYIKVKDIINNTIGNYEDGHQEISGFANDIVEMYIKSCYDFKIEGGVIELSVNKRNYEDVVMHELEFLDEPIHFTELYQILCEKYPKFKWREETVHSALGANEKALNVGKGLYIHEKKRPYLKGLKTTEDVIYKYLSEKPDKKALISEIIFFVKQYKEVDSLSIEAALNLNKSGNFVKINNKEYGLKGYW